MQITVENKEQLKTYFDRMKQAIERTHSLVATKYLKLADQVVRVLCYTPEVVPLMQKQLTYTLLDESDRYDSTIVVWHEVDVKNMTACLDDRWNPKVNLRMRIDMIYSKGAFPNVLIMDSEWSECIPVLSLDVTRGFISGFDREKKTCYYGVPDFDPEEFIKEGHMFVQQINRLIQNDTTNIAHGAIIGYNNNGLLMCARGQRGKSTLTVHAMMHGFEYVSDDYQILQNRDGELYSWPIYSIITLSPKMYGELYDDLKGKFVSNNARKDKYVINIEGYHDQFKTNYPIRLCLFPEIVSDPEPSITFCTSEEKGRAIVQLIQSTVSQMQDLDNHQVIKKMFDMVKDLDFYKFNLCRNIDANTEYLRNFLKDFDFSHRKGIPTDKIMVDITFDLANILDSKTYTIYSMNKLATNVYEKLLNGVKKEDIWLSLEPFTVKNETLKEEFGLFVDIVQQKGFVQSTSFKAVDPKVDLEFAEECNFKLSLLEFAEKKPIELINLKKGK